MERCERIRPLLHLVVESEAAPDEAMRVARHLPTCTGCRILLARERRVAELLEQDLRDLPVGEGFVEAVMARVPDAPPRRTRRTGRRGLALAGLSAFAGLWLAQAPGAATGAPGRAAWSLASPDAETLAGSLDVVLGLLRLPLWILERWGAPALGALPHAALPAAAATLLLLAALGALCGSTLVAVLAGRWIGAPASPRS